MIEFNCLSFCCRTTKPGHPPILRLHRSHCLECATAEQNDVESGDMGEDEKKCTFCGEPWNEWNHIPEWVPSVSIEHSDHSINLWELITASCLELFTRCNRTIYLLNIQHHFLCRSIQASELAQTSWNLVAQNKYFSAVYLLTSSVRRVRTAISFESFLSLRAVNFGLHQVN